MAELDEAIQQTVDRSVMDLVSDHLRQGGYLSLDQVERMIDKRNLDGAASLAVYRSLSERGIDIAEPSLPNSRVGRRADDSARTAGGNGPIFSEALSHPVLSGTEEIELGRRIELARKLEADIASGRSAD